MSLKHIKKSDGRLEEFNPDKLNKWGEWAAGIGVDWSSIVLEACRKCYDGCSAEDLHNAMIAACVDKETIPHLKMAGRLYIGSVYKKAFGGWQHKPSLLTMYNGMVMLGLWENMNYSRIELEELDKCLDHSLDLDATLTETKQVMDKYAIIDRVDKKPYESPQFVYMRMAMGNMKDMPKERRLEDVKKLYDYLSKKKINAPTPFMINLGTPKRQYASCCVTTTDDTAASLAAADHIAYMMTCASAGIGAHIKTRSKGDKVRQGQIVHQGKLPYYKVAQASVAANLQSSRGGALTMHFNCLDPELMDLLALKNVQTVEQKRIKDIDYSFGFNKEFARRVAKNESWMLVSYVDAPALYESMYSPNQETFVTLYKQVESDNSIPKTIVNARDIALKALTEGLETGRMYLHRTDELNRHTPFKDTIYSSNLCQEIALPTKGYKSVSELYEYAEGNGEIGLCSLASLVAGRISDEEWEDVAYYTLLMIDNVLEIMDYPFPQLKYTAQKRRSVGVGITNVAYDMAKKGFYYSSTIGKKYLHRLAEKHSYFLHKASLRLAKERGVCEWMDRTKYPDGWLPIDTYNKEIDKVVEQPLKYDWETLRQEIINTGGLRHSVLEAYMPVESSSVATNTTNGIYPIRAPKIIKTSGTNKNLFIAPEYDELGNAYEIAWNIPTKDMIDVYAIFQKFTGQTISADLYTKFDGSGKRSISAKDMLTQFLYFTKMELKTRYYWNSGTSVDLQLLDNNDVEKCGTGGCTL